jgi:hypothetical protein
MSGRARRRILLGTMLVFLVAAALVAVFRRHAPIYSVRVMRYDRLDSIAVVEITNNSGSALEYTSSSRDGKAFNVGGILKAHSAVQFALFLPDKQPVPLYLRAWDRQPSPLATRVKVSISRALGMGLADPSVHMIFNVPTNSCPWMRPGPAEVTQAASTNFHLRPLSIDINAGTTRIRR